MFCKSSLRRTNSITSSCENAFLDHDCVNGPATFSFSVPNNQKLLGFTIICPGPSTLAGLQTLALLAPSPIGSGDYGAIICNWATTPRCPPPIFLHIQNEKPISLSSAL